ncbi:MAG: glutathione S-transferase family protein [Myxococcota bacterium]
MTYTHYGWPSSPYSAKSRAALRASGLPWTEAQPHALSLAWLQAHVGRKVIPVMRTPSGQFVQDSSRIVDTLTEASGRPLVPEPGLARVLASWVEVFADEWMIYPAMYFRWRYHGGDFDYMVRDFGRCALPGLPGVVQRRGGLEVAKAMSRYLPIMGIDKHTGPAIETLTLELLDRLEARLDESAYVFGETPCVADFALYGPLGAHVGRDPWSAGVIDARPSVRRWLEALDEGRDEAAPLSVDEALPPALASLLRLMFEIAAPAWVQAHGFATEQWEGPGSSMHRRVGTFDAQLPAADGITHSMKLTAVTVWKMHRPLRARLELPEAQARAAGEVLESLGASGLLDLPLLDGFDLDSIAWRKDQTSFGPLGKLLDSLTPALKRAPAWRPLHPLRRGPVRALG